MQVFAQIGARFVGAAIVVGAAVLAYSAWDLATRPVGVLWVTLLVMTVASGWASLRIPSMPISFSISDTFNIIAALLVGPSAGAVNAAVDGLVLSYRMASTRRSLRRVLFNMAAPAIATWVAAKVFFWLAGERPPIDSPLAALSLLALLTVFGALDFGLNTGLVAVAVGLETSQSIIATWRKHFSGLWVTFFGGVIAAMLLMALTRARVGTLEMLLLIIPLPVLLHVTFRHALGRAEDRIEHLDSLNKVYFATIEALAQAIDAKDQVTHDHIRRVQDRAIALARKLGVADDGVIQAIRAASLLHDVGKLAIPEHVLNKPGKLTEAEFETMKTHAAIGSEILSVIGFPYPVVPIVRHHHENWDGTGYPDGLEGEDIPIGARILMVVDCFDALTSDRPYRPRIGDAAALEVLTSRKGTMYDPRVVDAFFDMYEHEIATAPGHQAAGALAGVTASIPSLVAADGHPTATSDEADFEMFYDLGRALTGTPMTMAELGDTLWSHLRRHIPASTFVLFVHEARSDSLVRAYHSPGTHAPGGRIPLGERLSGWVAATGKVVLNAEARLDLDDPVRPGSPLRSALCVPVTSAGRTTGVLAFYADGERAFDERHRRMAQAAARAAAQQIPVLVPRLARA